VLYERFVFKYPIGSTIQRVKNGASVFVPYCRQNPIGGNRALLFRRTGEIVDPL